MAQQVAFGFGVIVYDHYLRFGRGHVGFEHLKLTKFGYTK